MQGSKGSSICRREEESRFCLGEILLGHRLRSK